MGAYRNIVSWERAKRTLRRGSISVVSPVATSLMGKAVGDVIGTSGQELEIIAIS
jgi:transcription elongation GreA/GreB family factor